MQEKNSGWFRQKMKKITQPQPLVNQNPSAQIHQTGAEQSPSNYKLPEPGAPQSSSNQSKPLPPQQQHSAHQQAEKKGFMGNQGGKKMRIIPLGGLEEVGQNINAIEYGNDIVLIDTGFSFAGPDLPGINYIIPDISYVESKKRNVRGILFTHGHLDHIGAINYILPKLGNPPIYCSKLTAEMVKSRLKEFNLDKTAKIHVIKEGVKIRLGNFTTEFFRINHSIPDSMGIFLESPAGKLVHTGDFKFDHSPAIDKPSDFQHIAAIGARGIDVLLVDSTNALKPGYCRSEAEVAKTLERIIAEAKGRVIIASFASLIGRINQIVDFALINKRKVFLSGRSMVNTVEITEQLGYASYPKGSVRKVNSQVNTMVPNHVLILTTGAQGETLSALKRMAEDEHADVKLREGDTVVISASPIPGNEVAVTNVINLLHDKGANVITNQQMDIHVSGHAHQEELKLMYGLIQPKAYVPIHGELYMRMGHIKMIKTIARPGLLPILLKNNGDVLEVSKQGIHKTRERVPCNDLVMDGTSLGSISSRVIEERLKMGNAGTLILILNMNKEAMRLTNEPDVIHRGLFYETESQGLVTETKKVAIQAFEKAIQKNPKIELKDLKGEMQRHMTRFFSKRLNREPEVISVIHYA